MAYRRARRGCFLITLYPLLIAISLVALLGAYFVRPYYPSLNDMWQDMTSASVPVSPAGALPPVKGDMKFGVAEAFHAPAQAQAAGAQWERIVFWWSALQPSGPNSWNNFYLGPYDYFLKRERNRGFDVVGVILNTPAWAATDQKNPSTAVPVGLYKAWDDPENTWGQFIRKLVSHYKGDVDTWIIGNEPDIRPEDPNHAYFTWQGSVEDYAQLLKVAYLNAKAVNPNATIVTAGLTYWTDKQAGRPQFFERMLAAISKDPQAAQYNYYFDIAALHLYIDPRQLYTVPVEFREIMRKYGISKKIWVTEANVAPYDDRDAGILSRSDMRVSLEEQAAFILQAFAYGSAAGVERIGIYKMRDSSGEPVNGQALMRSDGTIRPAYIAYQVAAEYFSHADSVTLTHDQDSDVDRIVFDEGNRRVTALWTFSAKPQQVKIPVWGTSAFLINQEGQKLAVGAFEGQYVLRLDPATANTDQNNPTHYLIGGKPLLLVEDHATPTTPIPGTAAK